MKTKKRALGDSSSITRPLALAMPLFLLACSSSSSSSKAQSDNDGGGTSGDAGNGGPADGATGDGSHQEGGLDAGIDPSLNVDPQDLDAPGGDPSLDIAGSQTYFDNGAPWVRVVFNGAWPPAATFPSWACSVLLGTQNAPVVTYTVQGLRGVQTDSVQGMDKAKVTFAVEPKGFRVLLADTTIVFDRYGLECDVEATDAGATVQDTSGSFVITTKLQRTFGP